MAYCAPKGIPLSVFLSWSQDDQDAALAWQAREASRCPGCGTFEGDWDVRDAWRPEMHVCPGCERLEQARDGVDPRFRGTHVRLIR